jgi:N-ethylmaleimide reductase
VVPRQITLREIPGIVEEYRRAAENAFAAGFDGVELHSGSGGLPHQFLATCANQRPDAYGGSVANRCRFVLEVVEALVSVRGARRVGIKIAPNWCYNDIEADAGEIVETYSYLARALQPMALAYVHVQFPPWGMYTPPRDGLSIDLVRAHYPGTLIGAGEFGRAEGDEALRNGRCDLIAFGRRFIANPDLVARFRRDAHENAWDEARYFTPDDAGFTDFKTLEQEEAEAEARA